MDDDYTNHSSDDAPSPINGGGSVLRDEGGEDSLIRLILMGVSIAKAAERLGIARDTAYRWTNSERFKMKMDHARAAVFADVDRKMADVQAILKEKAAPKALDTMMSLLDSENERIRREAAADLMDRDNRLSKTRKVEATHTYNFLTPSVLKQLSGVAMELRATETARLLAAKAARSPSREIIDMNTEQVADITDADQAEGR